MNWEVDTAIIRGLPSVQVVADTTRGRASSHGRHSDGGGRDVFAAGELNPGLIKGRNVVGTTIRLWGMLLLLSGAALGSVGPDIIVGDIYEPRSWGGRDGISAFSFGTVSCNMGDREVNWYAGTRFHPVISQNVYRYKDGQFEQIGQGWLKHGFCALALNFCFNDCQNPNTCDLLGVHCSDPYNSLLNGEQDRLGPKSQVNAATGEFDFPIDPYEGSDRLARRLQIHNVDLNPTLNQNAVYVAEAHYVSPDEPPFNTDFNNVSYRRVAVNGTDPNYTFALITGQSTQRQHPAIEAWAALDPTVRLDTIHEDGRFLVGSRATQNNDGTWRYNYAVYNMNSHRSARAFEVPLPTGAQTGGTGFHDVDYHDGEGEDGGVYDGTDWPATVGVGFIRWETDTYDTNVNANAIRWATMYNFWFDSNLPPGAGTATLSMFRPGAPEYITADIVAPVASSSLTCDQINKFNATCNSTRSRITIKVAATTKDVNGYAVQIAVDGQPQNLVLTGKKAKTQQLVLPGDHTVELIDPAGCRAPIVITCP